MTFPEFKTLLLEAEALIDTHPTLTRVRKSSTGVFKYRAKLVTDLDMDGELWWQVECEVRNTKAKGIGARTFTTIYGTGRTPAEAMEDFERRLDIWAEVLD